jgi:drug/metabolite transporter (DMT)-like permease
MTSLVVALVVSAALLHATWNALLCSRTDPLWSATVMSFAATAAAIPGVLILPLPASASWAYLSLSAVLQVAYTAFLVQAYRHADLTQAYPLARGSVPLLAALGGVVLAGEQLSMLAIAGVALASLGIMSLAFGKGRASPKAVAAAFANGLVIAAFTVTDGIGARLSGDYVAYLTWVVLLYGILMPAAFLSVRRRLVVRWSAPETHAALAAGLVQLVTYGTVIWALTLAPIGPVAALRSTNIVFAALLGRVFLREPLTPRRLGACVAIAAGAACLA